MMTIFCKVNAADVIGRVWQEDVPEIGPPIRQPALEVGARYERLNEWFDIHTMPTPTSVPKWVDHVGMWVETATLDELRAAKAAEITKAKIEANFAYFIFMEKRISVDDASFREMQSTNGYVVLNNEMPGGWPGGWKAVDNTYVIIPDAAAWKVFYNAMVNAGLSNFNKSQSLKSTLASATTVEQILAVEWE